MLRRLRRLLVWSSLALLLFVPDPPPGVPGGAGREPFVWDRDALWERLEERFARAREVGCEGLRAPIAEGLAALDGHLAALESAERPPGHPGYEALEAGLFELGPLVAACPERVDELEAAHERMRRVVKDQSRRWDANARDARAQVYRLLYGGRMAVEEVLLQQDEGAIVALSHGTDEPSATPSATLLGVRVHSGDVLVSRGGAPTSALIARGNDYPGNFSHVALVHVAEDTAEVSVVESHIEQGVVVSTLDQYLGDRKLRVMVLRLRADVAPDPMLPHRAAEHALTEARRRHIPYDFAMDHRDPSDMFCSEVASSAYRAEGVELWEGLTSMSSVGVTSWLAAFGVEHFETHGPSDLEYDPKLRVVAEWRDPEALFEDHLDDAVVDAMLEGAERGERLGHDPWMLPAARLAKAYSVVLNLFGGVGPVPEGMSATTALRAEWLRERHARIAEDVRRRAEAFRAEHGYRPPYWELVRLAREAKADLD